LKILHVVSDDDRRGAQVFAVDLSGQMRGMGHASEVVALAPGRVGGLKVRCLGQNRFGLATLSALERSMRSVQVTVAHGSSTLPACAAIRSLTGHRFVARQISETSFWSNTRSRRLRVMSYLRRADLVVALSESASQDLQTVLRVPPGKIAVAPNGVSSAGFRPTPPAERSERRVRFGLDPARPTVLSVGALVHEKGVDTVVRAVAATSAAQVLVVGDGPERTLVERLARTLLPERAVFTGPMEDMGQVYGAADIVALATRGGDSMPAVLIEAGLCGLPAVAFDVGAIAETLEDGVTGLVVKRGDGEAFRRAVGGLVTDEAFQRELGQKALERCLLNFEIKVVAKRWEEILAGSVL